MKFQSEIDQIEAVVRDRKTKVALTLISRFLSLHRKRNRDVIFHACDWFRRLGLHERGYQLLAPRESLRMRGSTQSFDGMRLLWAARFLNLMGATEFAVALLEQIHAETFDDHRIIGSIYLANFDHSKALTHLETMRAIDSSSGSYISRLSSINLADALNGIGKTDQAIALADAIFQSSEEPLLKGIALTAKGEYLARSSQFTHALKTLNDATVYFSQDDQTPDLALLLKWKGFAQAKTGNSASASHLFDKAFMILRGSSLRAETWLDVLRLRAESNSLPADELRLLLQYPGVALSFRAQFKNLKADEPVLTIAEHCSINLDQDEYFIAGRATLGIPIELRMVALIWLSGKFGIPLIRLKSILWSDQVYSFLQLENRLNQLLHRSRKIHGFEIRVEGRAIRISESQISSISVALTGKPMPPSFLSVRKEFTRMELQNFYRLTATPAWDWLQKWIQYGWIQKVGSGKLARYAVV